MIRVLRRTLNLPLLCLLFATAACNFYFISYTGAGLFFDAAQVEPALRKLIESKVLPAGGRALVPGCGRGYAVAALASDGREAIGIEIAPTAVKVANDFLSKECSLAPERARCIEGDFFGDAMKTELEGLFDVVYDCTFLCAIGPAQREAWASKMAEVVKPGGELVIDIFPIGNHTTGPPFAMSEQLVRRLLEPVGFECILMEPVDPADYARGKAMSAKESIARWRRKAAE